MSGTITELKLGTYLKIGSTTYIWRSYPDPIDKQLVVLLHIQYTVIEKTKPRRNPNWLKKRQNPYDNLETIFQKIALDTNFTRTSLQLREEKDNWKLLWTGETTNG